MWNLDLAKQAPQTKKLDVAEEWVSFAYALLEETQDQLAAVTADYEKGRIFLEQFKKYRSLRNELLETWTCWTPKQKAYARWSYMAIGRGFFKLIDKEL